MKAIRKFHLFVSSLFVIVACTSGNNQENSKSYTPSHVEIRQQEGAYQFYINNKPFDLKGVGYGYRDGAKLDILAQSGGNAIRTWGTRNADQLLDSAAKYGIMVAMGIGMGQQLHGFDYDDEEAVSQQFERIKSEVLKFKDHPNVLCWVVGNELNLFFDEQGNSAMVNPKTYAAVAQVTDYIHDVDPHHPVTTAFAGIKKDQIDKALEQCPQIDFLSLQVYSELEVLPDLIEKAQITMPYAVTEFGPRGHWEMPSTEWGREIEETSTVKALGVTERMYKGLSENDSGLCLGGFAFLWGQKQERTPTWYGTFLKTGEATERVDELAHFWSGKYPDNRAPKLDSFKLDDKYATENIYLSPGVEYEAKAYSYDPDRDDLRFEWIILKEVTVRSQGGARENPPDPVNFTRIREDDGRLSFLAPEKAGDYRLFVYVYDAKNKAGYANIPFYVK